MSAMIRSQVTRLLLDALEELRADGAALTPRELAGLAILAAQFDRPELAARFARGSWIRSLSPSEVRG